MKTGSGAATGTGTGGAADVDAGGAAVKLRSKASKLKPLIARSTDIVEARIGSGAATAASLVTTEVTGAGEAGAEPL